MYPALSLQYGALAPASTVVNGSGLISFVGGGAACFFGSQATPLRVANGSVAQCPFPAFCWDCSPGAWDYLPAYISLNGVDKSRCGNDILFYPQPQWYMNANPFGAPAVLGAPLQFSFPLVSDGEVCGYAGVRALPTGGMIIARVGMVRVAADPVRERVGARLLAW